MDYYGTLRNEYIHKVKAIKYDHLQNCSVCSISTNEFLGQHIFANMFGFHLEALKLLNENQKCKFSDFIFKKLLWLQSL